MKTISILLVAGLLALAGCGDDDDGSRRLERLGADERGGDEEEEEAAAMKKEEAAMKKEEAAAMAGEGTTITLGDSEFGPMLFDSKKQAIYIFENDSKDETRLLRRVRRGVAAGLHERQADRRAMA